MHVHVTGPDGEAKIWLEPLIAVARNHGMSTRDLKRALSTVRERHDDITRAWQEHFGG